MVKEAQAKGINTDFVGWNEDHTEARCKNDDLSIWFQPDGVLNFMGKDVILEIKTESTYQHSKRYEPKMDHKYQAKGNDKGCKLSGSLWGIYGKLPGSGGDIFSLCGICGEFCKIRGEKEYPGRGYQFDKARYYVSPVAKPGFIVIDEFKAANGQEQDFIYLSAFEGQIQSFYTLHSLYNMLYS